MTPDQIIKEHFARIGRRGGQSDSKVKAEAARENGKKGGRPKKLKKQHSPTKREK